MSSGVLIVVVVVIIVVIIVVVVIVVVIVIVQVNIDGNRYHCYKDGNNETHQAEKNNLLIFLIIHSLFKQYFCYMYMVQTVSI